MIKRIFMTLFALTALVALVMLVSFSVQYSRGELDAVTVYEYVPMMLSMTVLGTVGLSRFVGWLLNI